MIFIWGKIALQCCVGFCCMTTQINHNYTFITSCLSLHYLPKSHPCRSSDVRLGSLCYIITFHQLSILQRVVYMLMPLSPFIPLYSSPIVSISLFSINRFPFLPCKQVHQYHFSRFHIYALMYDICFSLPDLHHSV